MNQHAAATRRKIDGFGIVLAINNDSSQPETNGLVKSKLTFFYNVFVNKSDPDA